MRAENNPRKEITIITVYSHQVFRLVSRAAQQVNARPGAANDIIQRCAAGGFLPDFARQCITENDLALMPQQILEKLDLARRPCGERGLERACGREERASEGYPCVDCGTFLCLICTFRGVTRCSSCAAKAGQAPS